MEAFTEAELECILKEDIERIEKEDKEKNEPMERNGHLLLKAIVPTLVPCVNDEKHPFVLSYSQKCLRWMENHYDYEDLSKPYFNVLEGCNKNEEFGNGKPNSKGDNTIVMNRRIRTWERARLKITNYAAVVNKCPKAVFFDFDPIGNREERLNTFNDFKERCPKEGIAKAKSVSYGGRLVTLISNEFSTAWREAFDVNKVSFQVPGGELEIMLACKGNTFQACTLPDSPKNRGLHSMVYSKKINDYGSYEWLENSGWDQEIFLTDIDCLKAMGWYEPVMMKMKQIKILKKYKRYTETCEHASIQLSNALINRIDLLEIHCHRYDRSNNVFNLCSVDQMIRGLDASLYDKAWDKVSSSIKTSSKAKQCISNDEIYSNSRKGNWRMLSNIIKSINMNIWEEEIAPHIKFSKSFKPLPNIIIPIDVQRTLIQGLKETKHTGLITYVYSNEGICLEHILKAINCLDETLIPEAKKMIKHIWKEDAALSHIETGDANIIYKMVDEKIGNSKSSLIYLVSYIKRYNKKFYRAHIIPSLIEYLPELSFSSSMNIDLKDINFTFQSLIIKCERNRGINHMKAYIH